MQVYIVKYEKDGKEYKKVVLKVANELTNETRWYSGFLRELEESKSGGKSGGLEETAVLYPERENKK